VNRSALGIMAVIFVLLLVGLFFTTSSGNLSAVRQVDNAEASTMDVTGNQGTLLAIVVMVVVGSVVGMGSTIYGLMWFLNREVLIVQQQPDQGFPLLTPGEQGPAIGNFVENNFKLILIGMVLGAPVIFAILILLFG